MWSEVKYVSLSFFAILLASPALAQDGGGTGGDPEQVALTAKSCRAAFVKDGQWPAGCDQLVNTKHARETRSIYATTVYETASNSEARGGGMVGFQGGNLKGSVGGGPGVVSPGIAIGVAGKRVIGKLDYDFLSNRDLGELGVAGGMKMELTPSKYGASVALGLGHLHADGRGLSRVQWVTPLGFWLDRNGDEFGALKQGIRGTLERSSGPATVRLELEGGHMFMGSIGDENDARQEQKGLALYGIANLQSDLAVGEHASLTLQAIAQGQKSKVELPSGGTKNTSSHSTTLMVGAKAAF
jgi:hypothetical protein